MKIWNACCYVRLSREDGDKEESDSIINQKALVYDYATSLPDIKIINEYIDDGFSGVDFERPSFIKMMDEIKNGGINCIIVKDLSRFGRNFIEAGKYLEQIFPFLGVRFISVNDHYDSLRQQSYSDMILIPFKNLINDAYCRDISVKIRSQLKIKQKKGEFLGSFAVYGYVKDEQNRHRLVRDEYAADIVRFIFKLKIDGLSQQGIADKLNKMGVLSPMEYKKSIGLKYTSSFKINTQAKWSAVAVGRILSNEIYIGIMSQGKRSTPNHKIKKCIIKPKKDWVRVYDTHEPIVTQDDFKIANSLLSKDLRISPGNETVYTLSGITRCSDCGMNMIRKTVPSGGGKYFYYICKNSKIKKCTTHSISEKLLEESVLSSVKIHIGIQERAYINSPDKQEETQRLNRQLFKVNDEITKYKKLKSSLYESLMNNVIDEDEFKELKEAYSKRINEARKSTQRLDSEIKKILPNKNKTNLGAENFKAHSNIVTLTRKVVVSLINEIIVYEGNRIKIKFK